MGLYDTVAVEMLSADFQTKQLGEGMQRYRLTTEGEIVPADGGDVIAYHGLLHLVSPDEDGAEYMATFTHGTLESLDPIVGRASDADAYRCLGRGLLWTRDSW